MDGVNQGITVIVPLTARAIIVIVTPGPPPVPLLQAQLILDLGQRYIKPDILWPGFCNNFNVCNASG